jgi:hypothetical protein
MYRIIGADGHEYGPVSAEQLRQWIAEGRVNAETKAVAEGSSEWRPLGAFPEASLWFTPGIPPRPAPTPSSPTNLLSARRTNGFAVTGLVLGILSLFCLCCYGLPFNVVGLVFSIVGLVQIQNNPQVYQGKGLAIAGLILCAVSLLLALGILALSGTASVWHPRSPRVHRL